MRENIEKGVAAKKCKGASARPAKATIFFRTMIGDAGLGPGKADLLARIEETGSLAAAARRMKMSHMRAWTLLQEMQKSLLQPAVVLSRGGGKQGGAQLTESGRALLAAYRELEQAVQKSGGRHLQKLAGYFLVPTVEEPGKK